MTDDKDANFHGWFPEINEHRTLGPHRASCSGCGQYCYPSSPCYCCGEPLYELRVAHLENIVASFDAGRRADPTEEESDA